MTPPDDSSFVDFVVCAHDEAETIRPVIAAIKAAASSRSVFVVADACSDATVEIASSLGVDVYPIIARDKGTAMARGLERVRTPYVGFVDADLEGLEGWHLDLLVSTAQENRAMVVGARSVSIDRRETVRLAMFPPIGGERVLPTSIARAAILAGSGYGAEIRLARSCWAASVPIIETDLPGLHHLGEGTDLVAHLDRWLQLAQEWFELA